MAITYNPYNWKIRKRERTLNDIINERRNLINRLYDALDEDIFEIHKILEELFEIEEEYIKFCYDNELLTLGEVLSLRELSR